MARCASFCISTVSVAAPCQIGLSQISAVRPEAFVDHRLQARAVSAGLGAKNAGGVFALLRASGGRVDRLRLIKGLDCAGGTVDEGDQLREGIAKEARDAQCDIDAGAAQRGGGDDSKASDAAVGGVPCGLYAHQGQRLCYVIAPRAHVGGAPCRDQQGFGPVAFGLQVSVEQQVRRLPPQRPSGRWRHGN